MVMAQWAIELARFRDNLELLFGKCGPGNQAPALFSQLVS